MDVLSRSNNIAWLVKMFFTNSTCIINTINNKSNNTMYDFIFINDKCASLTGKPKIFFIQACRGDEVDVGVEVTSPIQNDGIYNTIYKIPTNADFLIMYSTFDGYYSWRHPVNGSWFIQSLCLELKEHAKNKDLQTILTFVNRRVATRYQSNVSGNKRMHAKKQIGTIASTLTRLVHFSLLENSSLG